MTVGGRVALRVFSLTLAFCVWLATEIVVDQMRAGVDSFGDLLGYVLVVLLGSFCGAGFFGYTAAQLGTDLFHVPPERRSEVSQVYAATLFTVSAMLLVCSLLLATIIISGAATVLVVFSAAWLYRATQRELRERKYGCYRRAVAQVYGGASDGAGADDAGAAVFPALANPGTLSHAQLLAFAQLLAGSYAPPRAIPRAGVVVGEIETYRAWRVIHDRLLSFNGTLWMPGVPMEGDVFEFTQEMGVYSWKDARSAFNYGTAMEHGTRIAIGRVKIWGEVVEHLLGYRSQFARPVGIIEVVSSHGTRVHDDVADELRRAYKLEQYAAPQQSPVVVEPPA